MNLSGNNIKRYILRRYSIDELESIFNQKLNNQSRNFKHYAHMSSNKFMAIVVNLITEEILVQLTDGWVEDSPIPEEGLYEFIQEIFGERIIKKYDELTNMNLQENIQRIKEMMGVIKESEDNDLILYHGSNTTKIFDTFKDNQFYTPNDYIASNYAYNFGGVMYKVSVDNLNSFDLKGYHEDKESEEHNMMTGLLMDLYGQNAVDYYKDYYFNPSPSVIFSEKGWSPIIEWAKDNGYNSIKFIDESFDTYVRGISYVIFDGNKPIITNVYDVTEAVESNFKKDFATIK